MTNRSKIWLALGMFALSGVFLVNFLRTQRTGVPMVYFYDQSTKALFAAPQNSVPPIRGTDDAELDAVRAVVYAPSGDCARERKIAYLEKYSPQLKAEFEAAQARPGEELPRMSRAAAQGHTFVRRPGEANWFSIETEEGARVVGEWRLDPSIPNAIVCLP